MSSVRPCSAQKTEIDAARTDLPVPPFPLATHKEAARTPPIVHAPVALVARARDLEPAGAVGLHQQPSRRCRAGDVHVQPSRDVSAAAASSGSARLPAWRTFIRISSGAAMKIDE